MCERNSIRALHSSTFKRRQQQRGTRSRRKHKTQRSASTNDLAVSCARRAASSFLLSLSSFFVHVPTRICIEENHKRIHRQSEAREKLERENAITGLNALGAVILRAELDHALFALSIYLMTVASVLALESINDFVLSRLQSRQPQVFQGLMLHSAVTQAKNSSELASIEE